MSDKSGEYQQLRPEWNRSKLEADYLKAEDLYEESDREAPKGRFLGRPIITRDTRINGGVHVGAGGREAIVVDDQKGIEMTTEISIDLLKIPEALSIDPIRKAQYQKILQQESDKLSIGSDYTQSQFALYASDENI